MDPRRAGCGADACGGAQEVVCGLGAGDVHALRERPGDERSPPPGECGKGIDEGPGTQSHECAQNRRGRALLGSGTPDQHLNLAGRERIDSFSIG